MLESSIKDEKKLLTKMTKIEPKKIVTCGDKLFEKCSECEKYYCSNKIESIRGKDCAWRNDVCEDSVLNIITLDKV